MPKPFKLPKAFTLFKEGENYSLVIKQVNPFWLILHIIIILSCLALAIGNNNYYFAIPIPLFVLFIIRQFMFRYTVTFNSVNIKVEKQTIPISSIKKILISRKVKNLTSRAQESHSIKTTILIKTTEGNKYIGFDLIEDYQNALSFLLKKVVAQDFDFIDGHVDHK